MKTPTQKALACLIALTVAMMAAFLTGCATSPTDDPSSPTGDLNSDFAFELFTRAAVSEAIGGDKETAQTVVTVSELILEALQGGELVIPQQVDAAIKDLVLSTDLEASTKQTILMLVDTLGTNYLARINAGQLDPNVTAPLVTILGWVKTTAVDTRRYGSAFSYGAPPLPADL